MSFLKGRLPTKHTNSANTKPKNLVTPYQKYLPTFSRVSSLRRLRSVNLRHAVVSPLRLRSMLGKTLWKRYFLSSRKLGAGSPKANLAPNPYRFSDTGRGKQYFFTFQSKKKYDFFRTSESTLLRSGAIWAPYRRSVTVTLFNLDATLLVPTSSNFITVEGIRDALSLGFSLQIGTPLLWNRSLTNFVRKSTEVVQITSAYLPESFKFKSCARIVGSEFSHKGVVSSIPRLSKKLFKVLSTLRLQRGLSALTITRKKKNLLYFSLYSYLTPESILKARAGRTRIPELRSATRGFYVTEQGLVRTNPILTSRFNLLNDNVVVLPVASSLVYASSVTVPFSTQLTSPLSNAYGLLSEGLDNTSTQPNVRYPFKYIPASEAELPFARSETELVTTKSTLIKVSRKRPKRKILLQKNFRRLRFALRRPNRRQRILRRRYNRFLRNYLTSGRRYYNGLSLRPQIRDYFRKKLRRFNPGRQPRLRKLTGLLLSTQLPHVKELIDNYKKIKRNSQLILGSLMYLTPKYLNLPLQENSFSVDESRRISANAMISAQTTVSSFSMQESRRASILNAFSSSKLLEMWTNPTLIKSSVLSYLQDPSCLRGPDITEQTVKWALKLQNQILSYLFGPSLTSLRKTNLWSVPRTNYVIRRKLLRLVLNAEFKADVATWFHSSLTRFIENCTGRKVALNFGPFVEGALTFWDHSMLGIWGSRISGFHKMLGHRIFAHEALMLVALSLRLKDPTFLANWIRSMLNRMSFWKYRVLFRYLKFLMRHLFFFSFPKFNFRGFKLRLKGKISVAGNARTRTLVLQVGDTSHSKMDNKVAYDLSYVNTFTGVLGFKLWFFY